MRAMIVEKTGAPDVMRAVTLPDPAPGPGEILVRIRAVGLNFPDILMIAGGYQHKPPLPFIPGLEAAGEVIGLGAGLSGPALGQRVIIGGKGGLYAEMAVVRAGEALPLPAAWSFEEGAAFRAAYATAGVALLARGRLSPGERVLVHGAAGGVGLATVELASALGAQVIASVGADDKQAAALAKGAAHIINHRREDFRRRVTALTGGDGVDLVFDPVGGACSLQSLEIMAWGGRLLVVGFAGGDIPELPVRALVEKGCAIVGVRAGEYARRHPEAGRRLHERLLALAEAGAIRPHIHKRFPLSEAVRALADIADRRVIGKIVLTC